MKKLLTILLSVALIFSLSACSSEKTDSARNTDSSESSQVSRKPGARNNNNEKTKEFDKSGRIEETVIYEDNDITITATGISYYNSYLTYDLLIENKSDDNYEIYGGSLGFSCAVINGYCVDSPYVNMLAEAGESTDAELKFRYDDLKIYGIYEVADIGVGLYMEVEDSYDKIMTSIVRVPTTLSDNYDYDKDTYVESVKTQYVMDEISCTLDAFNGENCYDNKYISVLSHAVIENSSGEKMMVAEIMNKYDSTLSVHMGNITMNGISMTSSNYTSENIRAGCIGLLTFDIDYVITDEQLKMIGFDSLDSICYSMYAYNRDSKGYNTLFEDDNIGISFNDSKNIVDVSGTEIYGEKDIQIVFKGLTEDASSYSDDVHAIFLVYNGRSGEIAISKDYDSEYTINGEDTYVSYWTKYIPSGGYGLMDVEFNATDDIYSVEDVTRIRGEFVIKNDSYKTIAKVPFNIEIN